jgi:hypothetical protein
MLECISNFKENNLCNHASRLCRPTMVLEFVQFGVVKFGGSSLGVQVGMLREFLVSRQKRNIFVWIHLLMSNVTKLIIV